MRNAIYFLLGVVLFTLASVASAVAPQTMYWATSGFVSLPVVHFTTRQEACDFAGPIWQASGAANTTTHFAPYRVNGNSCEARKANNTFWSFATVRSATLCADGSAPDTSKPLAQQCSDPLPPESNCPDVGHESGAGHEAYIPRLTLETCTASCGFTAAGAMKAGDKFISFGPYTSTGPCTAGGGGVPDIPAAQCSYRGPDGKCEAACPRGSEYRMVPTGAMACVKLSTAEPEKPKDNTCPRGYMNISPTAATGGVSCAPTGGLGDSKNDGPATCPSGQKSVSSNGGASYCVFENNDQQPTNTTTTKTPEVTTTNPDGSTTKTSSTTTTNRDGSTTTGTTTTTIGQDLRATTDYREVTTTTPDGKPGVSDGKPEDAFNLCKTNPGLNICKNSTVSTTVGTDGCAVSSCEGDAIQCAILREQQSQYCKLNTPNAQSTLGNSVLAGNDPLVSTLPTKQNAQTIGMQSLNQNAFLGAAACFPDKTIHVMGRSITLPFSKPCEHIEWLRLVVMTIAGLISLKILRGPVLGN